MGLQRVGHDWATELNWTPKQQILKSWLIQRNFKDLKSWRKHGSDGYLSAVSMCKQRRKPITKRGKDDTFPGSEESKEQEWEIQVHRMGTYRELKAVGQAVQK